MVRSSIPRCIPRTSREVIRGSDHIGNTARQIAVFKNMRLGNDV